MQVTKSRNEDIKKGVFNQLQSRWNADDMRFADTKRARYLQPKILINLLGLAMTDDERATSLGLPDGCRVRESAKIVSPELLSYVECV